MLRQYSDFVFFRETMVAMYETIQQDSTRRVLECQRRATEADQAEAVDLPAALEEGERVVLEGEIAKRCQQYRAAFGTQGMAPFAPRIPKSGSTGPVALFSPNTASPGRVAVKGAKIPIVRPTAVKLK
jgi:hypothetical protein